MGPRAGTPSSAGGVTVVGLGPGDFDRIPPDTQSLLSDPANRVIVRTLHHPAAEQLARRRDVETCDDLYERAESFSEVYDAIAERVVEAAPVVYAVPGSPLVGEFAVSLIQREAARRGLPVEVRPAESFIDAALLVLGIDPLRDGFQVLNGHELPDPLALDKPTLIAQLDTPLVLADVTSRLGRVVPDETEVTVLVEVGSRGGEVHRVALEEVDVTWAGWRTSLFVHPRPGGLIGAVHTMARLRAECPWDRQQTHQSLVKNLLEESHELAAAIGALPVEGAPDWAGYAEVEDELGDVLLQVLFHANIAAERGAFTVDDIAENLRQKLVRRHPHVFADVVANSAEEVKANWEAIKEQERGSAASLMDGVPTGMPGLHRAAKIQRRAASVGFDWTSAAAVFDKVQEEIAELEVALPDRSSAAHELGDLLFSVVNLARHLEIDPELALAAGIERFIARFRSMEAAGPLHGLTVAELEDRWEAAKRTSSRT